MTTPPPLPEASMMHSVMHSMIPAVHLTTSPIALS